ncbi:hypothetical protein Nepgr_032185 [Nepenthes gracilis]|uniref:Uncharacterized protein n=1 Tax=Nepenthes gracilis TaxID=150966 RepID=A0AAD3Y5G2_NEPGR|nr:hypothetical protein Nepgr_032185 [Nepenthes gracilis]
MLNVPKTPKRTSPLCYSNEKGTPKPRVQLLNSTIRLLASLNVTNTTKILEFVALSISLHGFLRLLFRTFILVIINGRSGIESNSSTPSSVICLEKTEGIIRGFISVHPANGATSYCTYPCT